MSYLVRKLNRAIWDEPAPMNRGTSSRGHSLQTRESLAGWMTSGFFVCLPFTIFNVCVKLGRLWIGKLVGKEVTAWLARLCGIIIDKAVINGQPKVDNKTLHQLAFVLKMLSRCATQYSPLNSHWMCICHYITFICPAGPEFQLEGKELNKQPGVLMSLLIKRIHFV